MTNTHLNTDNSVFDAEGVKRTFEKSKAHYG